MPHSEVSELIADAREQVLFLRDVGVDALEVELPEVRVPAPIGERRELEIERRPPPVAQPRETFAERFEKAPPPEKLEIPKRDAPPVEKPAPGSRLAVLPSLLLVGSRFRKAPAAFDPVLADSILATSDDKAAESA